MSLPVKIDYTLPTYKLSKEELKAQVDNNIQELRNDVSLDTNDKLRKEVRKVIKQYEEQRKNITREWDDKKKAFMGDVKYALEPAIELDNELTEEIDKEEELRKADKLEEIKLLEGYDYFIKYHDIDPKWYNKGTTLDNIQEAIELANEDFRGYENIIKTSCAPHDLNPKMYIDMLPKTPLDQISKRINEDAALLKSQHEPVPPPAKEVLSTEKAQTFTISITATKSQREMFKEFCKNNNIEWELLK